jgi:hypothetical protein
VVVVWACPEVGHLWFFDELLRTGLASHVLGRPPLPGEGGATSYPESHNLRLGLTYIRDNYANEVHYVIGLAADVYLQDWTLSYIHDHMKENDCVVFHWDNGCVREGVWHTNCFGVCLDERYWPPLSPPGHADTLERQWGMKLERERPPLVHKWHNSGQRKFIHRHENGPVLESRPQYTQNALPLYLESQSRLRRFFRWLKSLLRSTLWTRPSP